MKRAKREPPAIERWAAWASLNVPMIVLIPLAIVAFIVIVLGTLLLPERVYRKWWTWEGTP